MDTTFKIFGPLVDLKGLIHCEKEAENALGGFLKAVKAVTTKNTVPAAVQSRSTHGAMREINSLREVCDTHFLKFSQISKLGMLENLTTSSTEVQQKKVFVLSSNALRGRTAKNDATLVAFPSNLRSVAGPSKLNISEKSSLDELRQNAAKALELLFEETLALTEEKKNVSVIIKHVLRFQSMCERYSEDLYQVLSVFQDSNAHIEDSQKEDRKQLGEKSDRGAFVLASGRLSFKTDAEPVGLNTDNLAAFQNGFQESGGESSGASKIIETVLPAVGNALEVDHLLRDSNTCHLSAEVSVNAHTTTMYREAMVQTDAEETDQGPRTQILEADAFINNAYSMSNRAGELDRGRFSAANPVSYERDPRRSSRSASAEPAATYMDEDLLGMDLGFSEKKWATELLAFKGTKMFKHQDKELMEFEKTVQETNGASIHVGESSTDCSHVKDFGDDSVSDIIEINDLLESPIGTETENVMGVIETFQNCRPPPESVSITVMPGMPGRKRNYESLPVLESSDDSDEDFDNDVIIIYEKIDDNDGGFLSSGTGLCEVGTATLETSKTDGDSASKRFIAGELPTSSSSGRKQIGQHPIKTTDKIIHVPPNKHTSRGPHCAHADLERKLVNWLKSMQVRNTDVSKAMIHSKALEMGRELGYHEFRASNGWFYRFCKRRKVIPVEMDDSSDNDDFQVSNVTKFLKY